VAVDEFEFFGVKDPVMIYSSHLSHRIRFPISEKEPFGTFIKHREHV
jgi:hypothetical protein